MSPITDNHTIEKPAIPQTDGLIIIILYLAVYLIWQQTSYSFEILRAIFLIFIIKKCISSWKIPLSAAFGHVLPAKKHIFFLSDLFLTIFLVHIITGRMGELNLSFGETDFHFHGGIYRTAFSLKNIVDICLIAPIMEELFFRGFIISCLMQARSKKYTVFIFHWAGDKPSPLGGICISGSYPIDFYWSPQADARKNL